MEKPLTTIELFAGAGGLGTGVAKAGFHIAYANDCDTNSCRSYQVNHPSTIVECKNIYEIDFSDLEQSISLDEVTLLTGGPPCQGFSTVGSKNHQDPRNNLFHEFLRAVSQLNPLYILFENVSGFKRLYQGTAYRTLLQELSELGYECSCDVLDASGFGLPQSRLRTIVVAWKRGLRPVMLPTSTHHDTPQLFSTIKKLTLMDAISDLPAIGPGEEGLDYHSEPQNDYQRSLRGITKTLTEHSASCYGERMQQILQTVPRGGSVQDLPVHLRPKAYFKNTYARLLPDEPSPTITRNFGTPSSSRCIHPFQNRALSTREGARLQGFSDDYKFFGGKGSKNLQIGNAVPPILGEVVAHAIRDSIFS